VQVMVEIRCGLAFLGFVADDYGSAWRGGAGDKIQETKSDTPGTGCLLTQLLSDTPGTGCLLTQLLFIIIANYPVTQYVLTAHFLLL
jgi:hypothetical protein